MKIGSKILKGSFAAYKRHLNARNNFSEILQSKISEKLFRAFTPPFSPPKAALFTLNKKV
jgi:hypothetical protein